MKFFKFMGVVHPYHTILTVQLTQDKSKRMIIELIDDARLTLEAGCTAYEQLYEEFELWEDE